MRMTRHKHERLEWLRTALADVAGNGEPLDPADIEALPAAFRPRVKRIAEGARVLHADGDHQEALNLARAALHDLEEELPETWTPPPSESPRDLAAAVIDHI